MAEFRLKRGHTIQLQGDTTVMTLQKTAAMDTAAVRPADIQGFKAKPAVQEGDKVKIGTPLAVHKYDERVRLVSSISGTVKRLVRGKRRVLKEVVVENDRRNREEKITVPAPSSSRSKIRDTLLESGLFPYIRQRPFADLANPDVVPRDIFINGVTTAPLALESDIIFDEFSKEIKRGLTALCKLTDGTVHLSLKPDLSPRVPVIKNVQTHTFYGKHPAGSVGVQIHHLAPIRGRSDVVWTLDLTVLVLIGRLFTEKAVPRDTIVKVAGPAAIRPSHVRVPLGAPVANIIGNTKPDSRIILGDVLTGVNVSSSEHLAWDTSLLSVISEPKTPRFMGWMMPGFRANSFHRLFVSSFFPGFKTAPDASVNGSRRPFIATGVYEKVLPMDIYPDFLFKAILAGDIEEMEGLGIYELAEEDVALCEYVCPSKQELQTLLRQGLEYVKKEG